MPDSHTPLVSEPLPLRYLLSAPASFDEALARGTVATGRLIAQAWDQQRLLENCAVRIQACLFGTAEQMWRQSLATCYLREPRRTERIKVG
jgi:hypothetical protein